MNREVYGRRYKESGGIAGCYYFVAVEKQTDTRNIHFHMVVCFPENEKMNEVYRAGKKKLDKDFFRRFWKDSGGGLMRTDFFPELEDEKDRVLAYCVKQILLDDSSLFFERLPEGLKGRKKNPEKEIINISL